MSASEAAARIAAGEIDSEELVLAFLARIAERDPEVCAWAQVDAEGALEAAREADRRRRCKLYPLGPLHGVPIGVKDVIAASGLRTECNSEIYLGRSTQSDAAVVSLLRAAGTIILGKTATVELAAWGGRTAATRNPHDLSRTPGGSSSGSAASVADWMVPLALGTQTGGSMIRPASFCGVVGFKPTFGTVSTEGVASYAPMLDTVGWYARSVEDAILLASVLDIADEPLLDPPAPKRLHIGLCRTHYWNRSLAETRAAVAEARQLLLNAGATVTDLELGEEFAPLNELQRIVMWGLGRISFLHLERIAPNKLSPGIRKSMERMDSRTLCAALDQAAALRPRFDAVAAQFDAVMTPSAPGEAPVGLASTGDSTFNKLWTLLHVPCISLPGLTGAHGMPVGIQLVGPRYADARLLAVARTVRSLLQRPAKADLA